MAKNEAGLTGMGAVNYYLLMWKLRENRERAESGCWDAYEAYLEREG
jgi:hypothetical protein